MKKQLLFILSLLLVSHFSIAQSEAEKALLDKMSDEACRKLEKSGLKEKDDVTTLQSGIGMAILPVFQDHKAEIQKLWNLDITVSEQAQKAGEKLGSYMVISCPKLRDLSMALIKKDSDMAESVNKRVEEITAGRAAQETITGKITKVEGTELASVYVNTGDDETMKLTWLEIFTGSDLVSTDEYKNKTLRFTYVKKSVYQPQTKSYRDLKVIVKVESL